MSIEKLKIRNITAKNRSIDLEVQIENEISKKKKKKMKYHNTEQNRKEWKLKEKLKDKKQILRNIKCRKQEYQKEKKEQVSN